MNTSLSKPTPTQDEILMGVVQDFSAKLRAGQHPSIDAYLAQNPDLAEMLRDILPAVQTMIVMSQEELNSTGGTFWTASEQTAQILGDYRIIREIGRGGMGIVYEAEQISLRRMVALKILPYTAMLDSRRLQRFKNEAHAAATLNHHNIVNVFSIGSERSVHYYAMQLIEGQTLAQLIGELRAIEQGGPSHKAAESATAALFSESQVAGTNAKGLSQCEIDETSAKSTLAKAEWTTKGSQSTTAFYRSLAKVMQQACEALDYAHEHGVIHRDIKPSNLMVDSDLRLWVTDFGLAQIESDPQITMTGDIVGTLRYMSPEQALGKRVTIDHRTDIYSLGATLYEFLTLQPVILGDHREQVLRSIAFDKPRQPRKLRRSIPVDLETIVLKALEKSPDVRYQSAGEMAKDLSRYLNHEPIRARKPNVAERTYRWSMRHPAIVSSVMLALLLIAIGSSLSAGFIWQANERTRKALISETQATQAAELRTVEIETVLDYLINDLLIAARPAGTQGKELTVKEVFANAEKRLESKFDKQPAIEASVRFALGWAYMGLSDFPAAERHFKRSAQIRTELYGFENADTLQSSYGEALIAEKQGRYDEASLLLEKVAAAQSRVLGPESRNTLRSRAALLVAKLRNEEMSLANRGDKNREQIVEMLGEVTGVQRRVLGPEHVDTLHSIDALASALTTLEKFQEAYSLRAELTQYYVRELGPDNTKSLSSRHNEAVLLANWGKRDEARKLFTELIDPWGKVYGKDHPGMINLLQNLATIEPNLVEQQKRYEDVLETLRRVQGNHPKTTWCLNSLGDCLRAQGKYSEAEPLFLESIKLSLEANGKHTKNSAYALRGLAELARDQDRFTDAERYYVEARDAFRSQLADDNIVVLDMNRGLVETYANLDQLDKGRPLLDKLLQHFVSRAKQSDATAFELAYAAWLFQTISVPYQIDYDRNTVLEWSQRAYEKGKAENDRSLFDYLDGLALAQYNTDQFAEAVESQKQGLALYVNVDSPRDLAKREERLKKYEAALQQSKEPETAK